MSQALDSCYAKLRQAEGHAQTLHGEIRAFQESGGLRIGHEADPQSSNYIFYVKEVKEPPVLDWGCRMGDVLHNLHSALDHLAWQLAAFGLGREPTKEEAKSISCPIALTSNDFNSLAIIKILDPSHLATLRGLQPYQRGNRKRAEGHPLAIIKELSNIDKHRLVHISHMALKAFPFKPPTAKDYEITRIVTPSGDVPLKDGQELARVEGVITGPEPEIEGHAKLTGHVALGDGTPVQHRLDQFGRAARHFIDQFKSSL